MADAIKTTLLNKAWELLEDYEPFASKFPVGNKIKMTESGWLKRRMLGAPNDYPKIKLEIGSLNNSGFTNGPTFAAEGATFADDGGTWDVVASATLALTITTDLLKVGLPNLLEEYAIVAFLLGGPKFGLPSLVSKWGPINSTQEITDRNDSKNTQRIQSISRIPVEMVIPGQTFINPTL